MLTSQDYNVGQAELPKRYYNRQVHLQGECSYSGLSGLCGRIIEN